MKAKIFVFVIAFVCFLQRSYSDLPPLYEGVVALSEGKVERGRLAGKIEGGRYYAFDNLFSVAIPSAVKDGIIEDHGSSFNLAAVAFYNDYGFLLKIQIDELIPEVSSLIVQYPSIKEEMLDALFNDMLVPQLKEFVPDLTVLNERPLRLENGEPALFAVVNLPKASTMIDRKTGQSLDSKRGYLVFFSKDKHLVNFNMQDTISLLPTVEEAAKQRLNERLLNNLLHSQTTFQSNDER